MTTTAYLDLFLRSVTEPALLQTLLSFILLHQHEGVHILDTLVSRINTPFQVHPTPTPTPTLGVRCNTQMQHDSGLINPEAFFCTAKTSAQKLAGCRRIVAMVTWFQWHTLLEKQLTHQH